MQQPESARVPAVFLFAFCGRGRVFRPREKNRVISHFRIFIADGFFGLFGRNATMAFTGLVRGSPSGHVCNKYIATKIFRQKVLGIKRRQLLVSPPAELVCIADASKNTSNMLVCL